MPHEASSGAVQIVVPTETASGNYNYVSTPEAAAVDDGSQGGAVRVGAACAQVCGLKLRVYAALSY